MEKAAGPLRYVVPGVAPEPALIPLSSFVQSRAAINMFLGTERLEALGTWLSPILLLNKQNIPQEELAIYLLLLCGRLPRVLALTAPCFCPGS